MNRLSFLKTLGVGIAAAVITPKVLSNLPPVLKADETEGIIPYIERTSKYGHYEEPWVPSNRVEDLRVNDLCMDKDQRVWLCTAKGFDSVDLTAIEAYPEPNFIEVANKAFPEYFLVFSSVFMRGTGGPQ